MLGGDPSQPIVISESGSRAGSPLFCPENEETHSVHIKMEDQATSNDDPIPPPPLPQPAQKKAATKGKKGRSSIRAAEKRRNATVALAAHQLREKKKA
jgi:hypothetical protein